MLWMANGVRGAQSLRVRKRVEDIVRHVEPRDYLSQMAAIYNWFTSRHGYLKDPVPAEMVTDPERIVSEIEEKGRFLGDCDDAATFLTGAIRAIGIRAEPVRVSFKGTRLVAYETPRGRYQFARVPSPFTHVLAKARDQYGRVVALDPVAGSRTWVMLRRTKRFG